MNKTCIICCEKIKYFTIFKNCPHTTTCYKCTLTNRIINKNFNCCFCRSTSKEIIFSEDPNTSFPQNMSNLGFDNVYKVYYTTPNISKAIRDLRSTKCRICSTHPPSFNALEQHYKIKHNKAHCQYCISSRKVFLKDQKLYDLGRELEDHIIYGEPDDTYGYVDGHPKCLFCNIRFFSEDELLLHLKKSAHRECFICKRKGIPLVFYKDYQELQKHFAERHFLCPHENCKRSETVFARRFELEYHMKLQHGKKKKNISVNLQQLMDDDDTNDNNSLSGTPSYYSNNQVRMGELGMDKIVFVGVPGKATPGRRISGDLVKNYLSQTEFEEFQGKFFDSKNLKKNNKRSGYHPFLKKLYNDHVLEEMEFKILEVTWFNFIGGSLKSVDFYTKYKSLLSQICKKPKSQKGGRGRGRGRRGRGRGYRPNDNQEPDWEEWEENSKPQKKDDERFTLADRYFPEVLKHISDPKIFEALKAAKATCDTKEYQDAMRSKLKNQKKKVIKKKNFSITSSTQNFPILKSTSPPPVAPNGKWKNNNPHQHQHHHNHNHNNHNNNNNNNNQKKKNRRKKNKNKNRNNNNNVNNFGPGMYKKSNTDQFRFLESSSGGNKMGGISFTVKKKKKKK